MRARPGVLLCGLLAGCQALELRLSSRQSLAEKYCPAAVDKAGAFAGVGPAGPRAVPRCVDYFSHLAQRHELAALVCQAEAEDETIWQGCWGVLPVTMSLHRCSGCYVAPLCAMLGNTPGVELDNALAASLSVEPSAGLELGHVDALTVKGHGEKPWEAEIADAALMQRILGALEPGPQEPSGGKRAWTLLPSAGGQPQPEIYVYPGGEWGYGGQAGGRSPELQRLLDSLPDELGIELNEGG